MSRRSQERQPSIRLHIDRLVLEGVNPRDRRRIAAAVESEIARLIAAGGVPPALAGGGNAEKLNGGSVTVNSGSTLEKQGAEIARRVVGGPDR